MRSTTMRRSLSCAALALALLTTASQTGAGEAQGAGVGLLLSAFLAAAERHGEEQLPAAVTKTLKERFPAAAVLTFDLNHRRGVLCYDIVLSQVEHRTRVEIAEDGSVGEIRSRLSLEVLPAEHQAMVLAATGDGEVCTIDTHLRLGLAHEGTFALLAEPEGFHDVTYQRAQGERAQLVKIPFKGDATLAALGGRVGEANPR